MALSISGTPGQHPNRINTQMPILSEPDSKIVKNYIC
jgi:hypothetical protein